MKNKMTLEKDSNIQVLSKFLANTEETFFNKISYVTIYLKEQTPSRNHCQLLLNYLFTNLEFVTNIKRFIEENETAIQKMLLLIDQLVSIQTNDKVYIKPTVFEVFIKLQKIWIPSNQENLIATLATLLEKQQSKKYMFLKPSVMVETLALLLDQWKEKEKITSVEDAVVYLLDIYVEYVKNNPHNKKVLSVFCQRLLKNMLIVYGYCIEQSQEKSLALLTHLEQVLNFQFSTKEIISSVKMALSEDEKEEPKSKKMKIEKSTNLFEILLSFQPKENFAIIRSFPIIYKYVIMGSRKLKSFNCKEEFLFTIKLAELFGLDHFMPSSMPNVFDVYSMFFNIVMDENVFKPVDDKLNGHIFEKWMKDFTKKLIAHLDNRVDDDERVQKLFNLLKIIFLISHKFIEDDIQKVIRSCVESIHSDDLLCEILKTFTQLNQLLHFISNFGIAIADTTKIHLSAKFFKKLSQAVSMLEINQVTNLLNDYIKNFEKYKNRTQMQQLNITYASCYLPIINASVIPENGYMKAEHQNYLKTMEKLKDLIDYKTFDVTSSSIIKLAINKTYLLLSEFGLIDETLNHLMTSELPDKHQKNSVDYYLKISLLFDKLVYDCCEKTTVEELNTSLSGKEISLNDTWNGDLPSIDNKNIGFAIFNLLKNNQSLLLLTNDERILSKYAAQLFEVVQNERLVNSDMMKKHEILLCFNNKVFQDCLLKVIWNSLGTFILSPQLDVSILLSCENQEFISSFNNLREKKFKHKLMKHTDDLRKILKGLNQLPISYFEQRKLECLYILLSKILKSIDVNKNEDICHCMFTLYQKIVCGLLLWQHKFCILPLDEMFIFVSDCFSDKINDHTKFLSVWSRIFIKYYNSDEHSTVRIFEKIKELISTPDNLYYGLKICHFICLSACHITEESVIRPKMESNILEILFRILTISKQALMKENTNLNEEEWLGDYLSMFALLCRIASHAQTKGVKTDSTEMFFDELLSIFEKISPAIHFLLKSTDRTNKQHYEVIHSIYCETNEFSLRMRSIFIDESTILKYTTNVLEKNVMEINSDKELNVVVGIIMNLPHNKLLESLELLVQKLENEKQSSSILFISLWNKLLDEKWPKEQRIILWDVLPKVLIIVVDYFNEIEKAEHIKRFLSLLISLVNISKNSVMSQYVSHIYHVFTILDNKPKDWSDCYFEEVFILASQTLFHHNLMVYNTLPSFLETVHSLLRHVVKYSNEKVINEEHVTHCCEKLSRLYQEIAGHKNNINKYAPFIVSNYIKSSQSGHLTRTQKKILDRGIFAILSTFTEFQYAMISTLLDGNTRDFFRQLKSDYDNFYKFNG